MKPSLNLILFVFLLAVLAVGFLLTRRAGPAADVAYVSRTEEIMATPITVLLPEMAGPEAAEAVFAVFRRVDAEMSEWKETSPLSALNAAAGRQPVVLPADLFGLLERGVTLGERTDGAFDVTWAALWGVWDFRAEVPLVPADDLIAARLALVDYRRLELDPERSTAFLPEPGMQVGLGGIAKGRALDLARAELARRGVESYLLSAGGQMLVGGRRGDRPWRIGIRDPRGPADDFFAHLDVADASVSTSGDYERFFLLGGVRYHHILDPRTGRPARGLRSATIVSADATLADALSTAVMVLGREAGMRLVETTPGVEAVLVDEAGRVHVSRGLLSRLHIDHEPLP